MAAEVYGFVSWILSFIFSATYLAWAVVPDDTLRRMGIFYYPNKYWAVAIPVVLWSSCWVYQALFVGYHMRTTPPLTSRRFIDDSFSSPPPESLPAGAVPSPADIHIAEVNRLLYRTPHPKTD